MNRNARKLLKRLVYSRKGFTLIELVVAMGLSSLVIGAGFAMFISSNQVYQSATMTSMGQQATRAALDIMAFELQRAGFGTIRPEAAEALTSDVAAEAEMTINSNSGSGAIQFKANLGATAIVKETIPYSSVQAEQDVTVFQDVSVLNFGTVPVPVEVLSVDRQRLFSANVMAATDQTVVFTEPFTPFDGFNGPSLDAGSIIVRQPVYVTYRVIDGNLVRCVRNTFTFGGDGGCVVDSTLNKAPTSADPNTTYYLAENIEALQFSYLHQNDTDFILNPGDRQQRNLIRAVKIDMLVRSKVPDPMIGPNDCDNGMAKRFYYLGDTQVDVGVEGKCQYRYMQMTTVVRTPNLY